MNTTLATTYSFSLFRFLDERKAILVLALAIAISYFACLSANAQDYGSPGTSTLKTPLVPGVTWTPPGQAPPAGSPPPPGSGAVPTPINPGQLGPPTLEPWVNRVPANQINVTNSKVFLPFGPDDALPPGVPNILADPPAPPSVPGNDPGMLRNPSEPGYNTSSATVITVPASGIYPNNAAPTTHRPGATTQDFGLEHMTVDGRECSTLVDFGQYIQKKKVAVEPKFSQDGPKPIPPQGEKPQFTQDLYGVPMLTATPVLTKGPLIPLTTVAPY